MKAIDRTESFTKPGPYATLYRTKNYSRYFLNKRYVQRYSMATKNDLSAGVLVLLLDDYFPGLVFIPKNSSDLGILKYIIQKNGKWTLDVHSMSKSKERIFSCLFPEKIYAWDEDEAKKRYGCADIIRFFIDEENGKFREAFASIGKPSQNPGNSIPGCFLGELDYHGKPVWEDWDFSALVVHKMRRHPPGIYEAFGYYAHRRYTLMGFGSALAENSDDGLLKSGTKLLNDSIREQIPETANFKIDRLTRFFEVLQETLESVPAGSSEYAPTPLDVLLKQLRTNMADVNNASRYDDEAGTYSSSEKRTINNQMLKAERYTADSGILAEIKKTMLSGTYYEKINLLHRVLLGKPLGEAYSRRELDIIHGLFIKQKRAVSLDKLSGADDEGDAFSWYDMIGDEKYISAEDQLAWSSFFRDEFAEELDKAGLEQFIEYLPDHFSKYPFDMDPDGRLGISKYSRKILFSLFCSAAGITQDNELWKPFSVLMKRVLNKINKSRES